ncbi:Lj928 prophage protein [Bacillus cereus AH1273]|nr:Lj928 prophage protein [Bacillus cereus AH1273]
MFDGKHSYYDMEYTISDRDVGFPSKEKIIVKVPFSNVEYDFSEIYGSQTYTSRPLTYTFNVLKRGNYTPEAMNAAKTELINWLMNSGGKQRLYDDALPGYYFLAEVEDAASFEDEWETGTLKVTFKAYPFMICEIAEGNDIWDTFNFDLDVSQMTDFKVNDSLTIMLLNVGTPDVTPTISTSSRMTIIKSGITYSISKGVTKDDNFKLKSGENIMTIKGEGKISFRFYKELI